MSGDAAVRAEWTRLREERAALRRDLVAGIHLIEERVQDPLGLKQKVREHPVLAAVMAACAGAIVVRLVVGSGSADGRARTGERDAAAASAGPSVLETALRDLMVRIVTPWVARFVEEHLGPLLERAVASMEGVAEAVARDSADGPATSPAGAEVAPPA